MNNANILLHPIRAKNRPEPGEQIVRAHSPAALPSKLAQPAVEPLNSPFAELTK